MFVAVILAINFAVTSVSVIYTFSIFAGELVFVIASIVYSFHLGSKWEVESNKKYYHKGH